MEETGRLSILHLASWRCSSYRNIRYWSAIYYDVNPCESGSSQNHEVEITYIQTLMEAGVSRSILELVLELYIFLHTYNP
jgi:hypothetical protein